MKLTQLQLDALTKAFELEQIYAQGGMTDAEYTEASEPLYAQLPPSVLTALGQEIVGKTTPEYLGELAADPVALNAWLERI